jgi:hypothetical protein
MGHSDEESEDVSELRGSHRGEDADVVLCCDAV